MKGNAMQGHYVGLEVSSARLCPSIETRLFLRELRRFPDWEDEEVEDWQIEEELPLCRLPPPLRPALVLPGGRTVLLDAAFEPHEDAWFDAFPLAKVEPA